MGSVAIDTSVAEEPKLKEYKVPRRIFGCKKGMRRLLNKEYHNITDLE
jgi:hypothetical protein